MTGGRALWYQSAILLTTLLALFLQLHALDRQGIRVDKAFGVWLGLRELSQGVAAYLAPQLVLPWVANPIRPFFYACYLPLTAPAFYVLVAWGVDTRGRPAVRNPAAGAFPGDRVLLGPVEVVAP